MSRRLFAVLQVRDTEIRTAVLVAAFFACIQASSGIGANTADALFFLRFGVNYLPYMFIALGAATFLASLFYTAGLGRFAQTRYLTALLLFAAILFLVERLAILFGSATLYPILWLTVNVVGAILGTMVWNVAGQICDARQAKRLFSLFASAGILGGVLGNSLTGPLASWLGTENLLFLCASTLLLGALFMHKIGPLFRANSIRQPASSLLKDVRLGFEITRSSPLMQLVAISCVLFSVLFFSMSFPFSQVVSSSLGSEAQVAGFLGLFSSVVTGITFLASLLLANRLFARIGVVNAVLLLPLTYLAGFVLWAVHFDLATAVLARLAQMVILGGVAGTAWNAFFNVIPPERRGQIQAFQSGVPSQLGVMLSGILLILGEQVLNTTEIFAVGMMAAAACGLIVWRMRSEYGASLLAALRAGLTQVFVGDGLLKLAADANARRVAIQALGDSKPTVRRTAVQILGGMGMAEVFTPALDLLQDPEPEVRIAVLEGLGRLKSPLSDGRVVAILSDSNPSVRAAGVRALAATQPSAGTEFIHLLHDADTSVRALAAAALLGSGEQEEACRVLSRMLRSPLSSERAHTLEAIAEYRAPVPADQILPLLKDDSRTVRMSAIRALGTMKHERAYHALVQLLDDADGDIRHSAAIALCSTGDGTEELIVLLESGSERAQRAALEALDGKNDRTRKAIADWASAQILHAIQFRSWALALSQHQHERAVPFLYDLLREREWETEQGILQALALLGTAEATRLIAQGLKSADQETCAQAIEALDTLADRRIAHSLVPLLEQPDAVPRQAPEAVLKMLSTHSDPWLRALAVHALNERPLRDRQDDAAQAEPERSARRGLPIPAITEKVIMPETTRTLSTVDRMLFLHRVSIFSHLAPEDLQSIADRASERLFPSGEYLCQEGEVGNELYIIVQGKVRVQKGMNGSARTLRILGVGEQIGELAILCEQPRSASVIAEGTDVRALVLCGDALQAILRDRPEVSRAMLSSLAGRLSTL